MESTHALTTQQATRLTQLIGALNAAQSGLQQYFSAVCDGLGLPEGTQLVRIENDQLVVHVPVSQN